MSQNTYQSRIEALFRRHQSADTLLADFPADETGHSEMPLSRMLPGDSGHVLSLRTECAARQHLMELGFIGGTEIQMVRIAPLGDPLTVQVRGYQLALRRREADAIWVRRCPSGLLPESDDSRGV